MYDYFQKAKLVKKPTGGFMIWVGKDRYIDIQEPGQFPLTWEVRPDGTVFLSPQAERAIRSGRPRVGSWIKDSDPSKFIGDVIMRDIGVRHSRWYSDGSSLQPVGGSVELDAQLFDVTWTDDKTTEQPVYEYLMPPWLQRENWGLEIDTKALMVGKAGVTCGLRLYLGSASMAGVNNGSSANPVSTRWNGVSIDNRNSMVSQVGEASGFPGAGAQQNNVTFNLSPADMRTYKVLQLRGYYITKGDGSLISTLHSVRLRLRPGV